MQWQRTARCNYIPLCFPILEKTVGNNSDAYERSIIFFSREKEEKNKRSRLYTRKPTGLSGTPTNNHRWSDEARNKTRLISRWARRRHAENDRSENAFRGSGYRSTYAPDDLVCRRITCNAKPQALRRRDVAPGHHRGRRCYMPRCHNARPLEPAASRARGLRNRI